MNEVIIVIITIALVLYNIERIIDLIGIVLKFICDVIIKTIGIIFLYAGFIVLIAMILSLIFKK
jgi:hypothetical protein